ncbi:MAG: ZIP family metal transporter [Candidatus Shapirobacteria bacterium]
MSTFALVIISTLLISLGALAGVFTLAIKEKLLDKIILSLVSFSAGALIAGAFFHLLPEALEFLDPDLVFLLTFFSLFCFLILEKIFHYHHCHDNKCLARNIGYLNLIGDSIHNFLDGLIIAAAFSADFNLGIATSLAVALHEIPQEIGDFGVLLYSGWQKKKALLANFLVALTVVLGGIVGYLFTKESQAFIPYLMPLAAGGFIYIAACDLLPEIRQEKDIARSFLTLALFLAGAGVIYGLKLLIGE